MAAVDAEAGLRVLILAELAPAERAAADALALRGFRVSAVRSPVDAMHTLRRDGADVVVLGLPLPGADAVAVCAALKEGPEPPAVLVARSEQGRSSRPLPEERRPDGTLARPLDAAKLRARIHECTRARDAATSPVRRLASELLMTQGRAGRRGARLRAEASVRRSTCAAATRPSRGRSLRRRSTPAVRRGAIGQETTVRVAHA